MSKILKAVFKVFVVLLLVAALFGAFDAAPVSSIAGHAQASYGDYVKTVGVVHSVSAGQCPDGRPGC